MTVDPDIAMQLHEAREARALVAARLVEGSCDLTLLGEYRRALTLSRLLGDISEEEAEASYGRACQVYAANCGRALPSSIIRPHEP